MSCGINGPWEDEKFLRFYVIRTRKGKRHTQYWRCLLSAYNPDRPRRPHVEEIRYEFTDRANFAGESCIIVTHPFPHTNCDYRFDNFSPLSQ